MHVSVSIVRYHYRLQVDLGENRRMYRIVTQGTQNASGDLYATTLYQLQYGISGSALQYLIVDGSPAQFTGNTDADTVVEHDLPFPVIADRVRLLVIEFTGRGCVRWELYGCIVQQLYTCDLCHN